MKKIPTLLVDLELERAKEEYICNFLAKKHYAFQSTIDIRKYKAFIQKEKILKQFLIGYGFKEFNVLEAEANKELSYILKQG